MVGFGPGDVVPLRAAGALIGPDGLAVRWTGICCACGAARGPTVFWGGDRRASTMFQPPPKKARDPRMRVESAVDALGGAAPTGAVPAGTFSTPVREKLWRTCPQFPVHGGSPSLVTQIKTDSKRPRSETPKPVLVDAPAMLAAAMEDQHVFSTIASVITGRSDPQDMAACCTVL